MPSRSPNLAKTTFSRVFTIDGAAGPANAPQYQGLARAGALSWPQGDVTPVRIPSATRYDSFDIVDTIIGQQGLPSLPIDFRMTTDASALLALVLSGCPVDIQVHFGRCKSPSDFNGGWSDGRVIVLEKAHATDYSTEDLGAMDSDQRAVVMETAPWTGLDLYEIRPLTPTLQAEALVTDEVLDVTICDAITCGDCGIPSDGCDVVFALISDSSGSPGISASVVWTNDGGANWAKSPITSLAIGQTPNRLACVGTYLVVLSASENAHHYIPIVDLLAGLGGWTKVTTGYVALKTPKAITAFSATKAWVGASGGYIYEMTDPTAGVTVLDAGANSVQDQAYIRNYDDDIIVSVGASNSVLVSQNAGLTFGAVTGPAPGVALTSIALKSALEWVVGTAGGTLFYTQNGGSTWTAKAFPGSGSGAVADVQFVNNTVGYLAHATAANVGRILRTIDGGYSWYTIPERTGVSMPTNRRINAVAPCEARHGNIVYAGGLGADSNDGVLIKAA